MKHDFWNSFRSNYSHLWHLRYVLPASVKSIPGVSFEETHTRGSLEGKKKILSEKE